MNSTEIKALIEWLSQFPKSMTIEQMLMHLDTCYHAELAKEENAKNRK